MSFLKLSREIRDRIYHHVLCPRYGIRLYDITDHDDEEPGSYNDEDSMGEEDESDVEDYDDEDESEDEDEDDDEDDSEEEEKFVPRSQRNIRATTRIPTSILLVNRQVSAEALQVLYRDNRFTFDVPAKQALQFLKGLSKTKSSYMRHLGFAKSSTMADDADCKEYWHPLCAFIARRLSISSVTIMIPYDIIYPLVPDDNDKYEPNSEWYWWPAVQALRDTMLAGKIEKLRLAYRLMYPLPKNSESIFTVIETLSTPSPRPKEEIERENREYWELQKAEDEGRPTVVSTAPELEQYFKKRRQRINFEFTQVNDSADDLGTVLVLTRPQK